MVVIINIYSPADYETRSSYTFDVIATDDGDGITDTQEITVNITDVNDDPELTSGATGTVVENLPISTAIYTASATDQDAGHDGNISFSIVSDAR